MNKRTGTCKCEPGYNICAECQRFIRSVNRTPDIDKTETSLKELALATYNAVIVAEFQDPVAVLLESFQAVEREALERAANQCGTDMQGRSTNCGCSVRIRGLSGET